MTAFRPQCPQSTFAFSLLPGKTAPPTDADYRQHKVQLDFLSSDLHTTGLCHVKGNVKAQTHTQFMPNPAPFNTLLRKGLMNWLGQEAGHKRDLFKRIE